MDDPGRRFPLLIAMSLLRPSSPLAPRAAERRPAPWRAAALWVGLGVVLGGSAWQLQAPPRAASVAAPATLGQLTGQACGSGTSSSRSLQKLFGGEYAIDSVSFNDPEADADPQARSGMLGGLTGLWIPTVPDNPFDALRQPQQIVSRFSFEAVGGQRGCLPEPARNVESWGWCQANSARGQFMVRYTVLQNLRIRRTGTMLANPFDLAQCEGVCLTPNIPFLGLRGCEYKDLDDGYQPAFYAGAGLPIAHWVTRDPSGGREAADRLYKDAVADQGTVASLQSFEVMLGATVSRTTQGGVRCTRSTFFGTRTYTNCQRRILQRGLRGFVLRRSYNDLRVGLTPDSAGGLQVKANVVLRGKPDTVIVAPGESAPSWYSALETIGNSLCGTSSWTACGQGAVLPVASLGGAVQLAVDDSVRAVQMCRKQVQMAGGGGDPNVCLSGQNPMVQQLSSGTPVLDSLAADRTTAGNRAADTVSTAGRVATGVGGRTIEAGVQGQVASQWRRTCQRTFARDSVRGIVSAPYGTPLDSALAPARLRLRQCLVTGGESVPATSARRRP